MAKLKNSPHLLFIIVISIQVIAGFFTFRDVGISWDEPYFYDYADSIIKAYSPQVLDPNFDFEQVYGKSAVDHKYYGPAYLLKARPFVTLVDQFPGVTVYDAWHLINFLFYTLGVFFLYLILIRWVSSNAAALASAFFAWQPLFFGHAFINPKDIPFLVICLISSYFGVRSLEERRDRINWKYTILFGVALGLTSSVRVIGPIVGVVFFLSAILYKQTSKILTLIIAGVIAFLIMIATWPFLWSSPIENLLLVLKHMSNNPTELAVLYEGVVFRANEMPRFYILKMLLFTLTEPIWFMAVLGSILFLVKGEYRKYWKQVLPFALIFIFMVAYILLVNPAVYDGFRHFFFIIPIVFIAIGFCIDAIYKWLPNQLWKPNLLFVILLSLGPFAMVNNHPYEYTYYNSFVGGTENAFRQFETDFWLTCYAQALDRFGEEHPGETLYIQRELPLAQAYEPLNFDLQPLPPYTEPPKSGYYLFHTRANLDLRSEYRAIDTLESFGVGEAQFCLIKKVP